MSDDGTDDKALNDLLKEVLHNQEEAKSSVDPTELVLHQTSGDGLEERRAKVWKLRQRGMTMQQIAEEVGVSIATVKRDIDKAKDTSVTAIQTLQREDYMAQTLSGYDDIIESAWTIYEGADKETKLKALNTIRMTLNDKRKALQDTGIVKKDHGPVDQVNVGIIANWSQENINQAVSALMTQALSTRLEEPEPDDYDPHEDIIDVEMEEEADDA